MTDSLARASASRIGAGPLLPTRPQRIITTDEPQPLFDSPVCNNLRFRGGMRVPAATDELEGIGKGRDHDGRTRTAAAGGARRPDDARPAARAVPALPGPAGPRADRPASPGQGRRL